MLLEKGADIYIKPTLTDAVTCTKEKHTPFVNIIRAHQSIRNTSRNGVRLFSSIFLLSLLDERLRETALLIGSILCYFMSSNIPLKYNLICERTIVLLCVNIVPFVKLLGTPVERASSNN